VPIYFALFKQVNA